ncbi:endonuclease/exonuclease/phosphatase family protein [Pseudenhygromyxa sp. WMMC2535]|uniref:endonuclease/exonuclease/phosphatase family protein n=1 Tax=Pseudenhygromyxa sp. WMMC2535 TaxID=2712867 RepID=UPI0015556EE7|nr:endonuclease/exonuclease/phosphatase family protein [Pseudenhygromyxa sp. WMMC2535]NVB37772.1 endonuclease/exonuclease/phosphatase family protein [Pseudenhygromyxa sp. WMMC2535]
MAFSVLSWNVKQLGKRQLKARTVRVAEFIRSFDAGQGPDVFALYEIQSATVIEALDDHFPNYDFFMTDGPQNLEILIAARRGVFAKKNFTAKREFKRDKHLRPGAMLNLTRGETRFNLLFLHVDSGRAAGDFGNRFDTLAKIWKVKRGLDKASATGPARFIAMGDLNTMGMAYPRDIVAHERISAADELAQLDHDARRAKMRLVPKDHAATWHSASQYASADLDHVIASNNVEIEDDLVSVRGWNEAATVKARRSWIRAYSDHCGLFFRVTS